MEIINKWSYREKPKPAKIPPVFLSVYKNGNMRLSVGLMELLGYPLAAEFRFDNGKLFIIRSTEETGFKIRLTKNQYTFTCLPVCRRFFNLTSQRAVVFTDPCVENPREQIELNGFYYMYEIKLPQ